MTQVGAACRERLDQLGLAWQPAEALDYVAAPVTVSDLGFGAIKLVPTFRDPPFVMDCHLVVAIAEQAAGLYYLGVRELHFSSIHRVSQVRVGGKRGRSMSRHALGLAIDVFHVVDSEGRKHSVLEHYRGGDGLLGAIENVANQSGAFRMVLTPGNDPESHYDHFHFEALVEYPLSEAAKRAIADQRAQKKAARQKARQKARKTARKRLARKKAAQRKAKKERMARKRARAAKRRGSSRQSRRATPQGDSSAAKPTVQARPQRKTGKSRRRSKPAAARRKAKR